MGSRRKSRPSNRRMTRKSGVIKKVKHARKNGLRNEFKNKNRNLSLPKDDNRLMSKVTLDCKCVEGNYVLTIDDKDDNGVNPLDPGIPVFSGSGDPSEDYPGDVVSLKDGQNRSFTNDPYHDYQTNLFLKEIGIDL